MDKITKLYIDKLKKMKPKEYMIYSYQSQIELRDKLMLQDTIEEQTHLNLIMVINQSIKQTKELIKLYND